MIVLLVDEAAGVRLRLRELLAQEGGEDVRVDEAEDPREACEIASSCAVDAVILDVHVRSGSGLEAISMLRARAPTALLIVLTNEATDLHRRECLRRGADHFFDKAREFDHAVSAALRGRAKTPSQA